MEELILTENVGFIHYGDANFTFPKIQEYLDKGFCIKSIFYTPLNSKSGISGVSITVHLVKQDTER